MFTIWICFKSLRWVLSTAEHQPAFIFITLSLKPQWRLVRLPVSARRLHQLTRRNGVLSWALSVTTSNNVSWDSNLLKEANADSSLCVFFDNGYVWPTFKINRSFIVLRTMSDVTQIWQFYTRHFHLLKKKKERKKLFRVPLSVV